MSARKPSTDPCRALVSRRARPVRRQQKTILENSRRAKQLTDGGRQVITSPWRYKESRRCYASLASYVVGVSSVHQYDRDTRQPLRPMEIWGGFCTSGQEPDLEVRMYRADTNRFFKTRFPRGLKVKESCWRNRRSSVAVYRLRPQLF
ncbi:hypothetical protein RRG08_037531 [Elysia crispata]|uniref:Uncharacterized protein n=1 Tax=Elysia crispata TaxID=231223 RepID=A0AAE1A3E3_9GAST|nr:hypothetical protein RRG08_037531 [Elysia crispata]